MVGSRAESTCWHSGSRCCHQGKQSEQILIKREDPAHGLRHLPKKGPGKEWLGWRGVLSSLGARWVQVCLSLPCFFAFTPYFHSLPPPSSHYTASHFSLRLSFLLPAVERAEMINDYCCRARLFSRWNVTRWTPLAFLTSIWQFWSHG